MHPQLARGSNERLAQNNESPELFERETEEDLLAGKVLFVETADLFVKFAPGKKESAGAQPGREVKGREDMEKHVAPERRPSIVHNSRTPSGAPVIQRSHRVRQERRGNLGVGVDKKEP